MGEIEKLEFDYSQLDNQTADFLQQKESNMREIVEDAETKIGGQLLEAQTYLASHNKYLGVFEKWYTWLGLNRGKVYRLIGRFDLLTNCENMEQKRLVKDLPLSLSYEISSPSSESTEAKKQAKQAVLDGDIKTRKEYLDLVAKLETKEEENKKLQNELSEQKNKTPSAQEVHIDNTDYNKINKLEGDLEKEKKDKIALQSLYEKIENEKIALETMINSEAYKLNELRLKEEKLQHEAHISIYELQIKIEKFIKDASPSLYLQGAIATGDSIVRKELIEATKSLEFFVENLKDILSNKIGSNVKYDNNIIKLN